MKSSHRAISLPLSTTHVDLRSGIELTLKKLKNFQARQQERLKALEKGEAVVIPQYFHSTDEIEATSIAKTGIEAKSTKLGFGAFVSTDPEFRFGYVTVGLPKTIEFGSQTHTVLDSSNTYIIDSKQKVWAGLKEAN